MVVWLGSKPYLLLTLTSLFWAGNAVVGRAVVDDIPPAALAQIRWVAAFLLILPFAWPKLAADLRIIRRHIGILLLLALTGISIFNTMLYWSLQHTTAINATLMQSSGPLLIGLCSFLLFRDPLTRAQIAGIVVSLCGVAVVVSGGDPMQLILLRLNIGDIAIVVAIAIYGIYSTLLRMRPGISQLSFAATTMGLGALMLAPIAVLESLTGAGIPPLDGASLAALAYIAVFPSVIAYLCYNRGVQLIGANRSGPFLHLVALFGALLSVIFLGERPGVHHAIGAVLILGGVVLASRRQATAEKGVAEQTRL